MLSFITTGNAGIMATSRIPLANLIPSIFGKINIKYRTPAVAIIFTAVFMIALILLLNIESLVKVASTMQLLLFTFENISVIILRESKIYTYKPSFKGLFYPYVQIIGIIIYVLLIIEMGKTPLVFTLGFFLVSLVWYFTYSKSRSKRDSALIHLVERISSKEIKSLRLSDELKDILIERD